MGCRLPDSDPSTPAASPPAPVSGLELTVVVPTFNERANVRKLISLVEAALGQTRWQVIFVDDDSPDGTAAEVKAVAAVDPRVQCLHRVGRRGLAGAVIEGIMASAAPFVAVMDGDLQHDETLLPAMLDTLRNGGADLAVGSRYCGGPGADASALGARREAGSRLANWLGRQVLKADLTDPMSGFFMVRRSAVEAVAQRLSTSGFKVLFDIVASQDRPLRIVELPYTFRAREAGDSKLDNGVVVQYLGLLIAKLSKDVISPRFLMFVMVGASGVLVHLAILRSLLHIGFSWAQTLAALGAMTSNYLINNAVTYRDRRLKGLRLISGYVKFCVLCSVPLAANVAVATVVYERGPAWWVAGLAGAIVAAAWNYVTTSKAVW
ncbi:MAG: glycosyltransferase family 2 protein [Phenylobacterium sp.]|nr:glycosyltransferase family 2 protein [Phenylobacterium sp.]MCA6254125.1 glycosyltransferase family 2 protein [Phenylobacterium sp.]